MIRQMRVWWTVVAAVMLSGIAPHAQADSIPLTNGSFETPALKAGTLLTYAYDDGTLGLHDGWDYQSGYADMIVHPTATFTDFSAGAADGSQYLGTYSWDPVRLVQTLPDVFQAGQTYTLSVHVGNPMQNGYSGYNLGLGTAIGYVAGLTDNTRDLGSNWTAVAIPNSSPVLDSWLRVTLSYTAPMSGGPVGQPIVITLSNGNCGGPRVGFDGVTLEGPAVPEPNGMILSTIGVIGLLAYVSHKES